MTKRNDEGLPFEGLRLSGVAVGLRIYNGEQTRAHQGSTACFSVSSVSRFSANLTHTATRIRFFPAPAPYVGGSLQGIALARPRRAPTI
jgi:hypothetical protein